MKFDLEVFIPIATFIFFMTVTVGLYHNSKLVHEARMACIENGNQWVSNNCVRS